MAKVIDNTTVQEKLYNLYLELLEAKQDKKDTVKAHSENIKRIESEIKELLDEDKEQAEDAQNGSLT